MKNIVVFGCGGHAKVVIDILEKNNEFNILGLIDDFVAAGTLVYGYEVLGDETILEANSKIVGGIVAIGDNSVRSQMVGKIKEIATDFSFITAVHPSVVIARGVELGEGTVVMPGAIINSDSKIGEHCIINTKASIDHDCRLGDYVSLAPGVTLGGNVAIGQYSAVSLGSSIIHSIKIGQHTIIGAGSTVLKDTESNVIAYGTPANVVRTRIKGEKYL
ncbi:acetyltransferase [Fictibacillus barbaricus]|uniref:Sugar O-acyltransferase (Sialic acid O-acetyltransferase NeuD family) n=1 Tax=Fictibacillus barbaricus TaxID=182136 RepID=A0ABU1U1L4_9BACL|nr:acetyltransferase [Fictibacillus barbaricus]MDR7073357.1 sugar O-acyltransferase (sialic acid O-acetyltransferase NeuD family) [Fictibacillus barbaricus]